jgi:hypothetical protein
MQTFVFENAGNQAFCTLIPISLSHAAIFWVATFLEQG